MDSSALSVLVVRSAAGPVDWLIALLGLALTSIGAVAFLVECTTNPEPIGRGSEARDIIFFNGMLACWLIASAAHKIFAMTGSHIGFIGLGGVGIACCLVYNAVIARTHEERGEFVLIYNPEPLTTREVIYLIGFFGGGIAGDLVLLFIQVLTNIPKELIPVLP
jgi:hypothetical protein